MIGPVIAALFLTWLAWIIVIAPARMIIESFTSWVAAKRLHQLNQKISTPPVYPWESR